MIESRRDRPKVLILAPIHNPVAYGASYAAQLLIESYFSKEYDLHHINTRFADTAADVGKVSAKRLVLFVKYLLQLVVTLITVRPDYVILNPAFNRSAYLKDSIYHVVCAVLMRRKVIWWAHNWGLRRLHDGSGSLMRRYIRWIAGSVYVVVTPGRQQHMDFGFLLQSKKLYTIPHGLPPEPYDMNRFDEHHDVRVLYLSNFALTKGWRVLLDAAQQVCACRADVTFDYYGNPSNDTSLNDIVKAFQSTEFPERIIYHGPAYGPAKHKAFEIADIFCFPTFLETFGLVNLEAMNAGLPIITTDHASISEIVIDGQGGVLVQKQATVALAEAILRLSENRNARQRMGIYNQRRFYEWYTVDVFAKKWINLIGRLEDERKPD